MAPAKTQESSVSEEMVEAAKADLERKNAELNKPKADASDLSAVRTKRHDRTATPEIDESVPFPEDFDFENYGPTGQAAVLVGERTGDTETQEFYIDAEKVKYLSFTKPGLNLPAKRLYTVKAIHKDGRLVQLPFEPQIQNNAGGDPEDAIGLRRYQRKGIRILIDFTSLQPVYCAAWGCWAKSDGRTGFCSPRHAQHTLPNRYKDGEQIVQGLMEQGVTTTRTWSV